jgi:hypothetical protein
LWESEVSAEIGLSGEQWFDVRHTDAVRVRYADLSNLSPWNQFGKPFSSPNHATEFDSGDNWRVVCTYDNWRRDVAFELQHETTGAFLHHDTKSTYRRPISGQLQRLYHLCAVVLASLPPFCC